MLNPLIGEATATIGDECWRLVMNNAAWIAVEELLDASYLDIVSGMIAREVAGKSAPLKTSGALLFGATRLCHPEFDFDDCCSLVREHGNALTEPLGIALRGSLRFKEPEPGEAEPAETPAKTKRTKPANGAGKTS